MVVGCLDVVTCSYPTGSTTEGVGFSHLEEQSKNTTRFLMMDERGVKTEDEEAQGQESDCQKMIPLAVFS